MGGTVPVQLVWLKVILDPHAGPGFIGGAHQYKDSLWMSSMLMWIKVYGGDRSVDDLAASSLLLSHKTLWGSILPLWRRPAVTKRKRQSIPWGSVWMWRPPESLKERDASKQEVWSVPASSSKTLGGVRNGKWDGLPCDQNAAARCNGRGRQDESEWRRVSGWCTLTQLSSFKWLRLPCHVG